MPSSDTGLLVQIVSGVGVSLALVFTAIKSLSFRKEIKDDINQIKKENSEFKESIGEDMAVQSASLKLVKNEFSDAVKDICDKIDEHDESVKSTYPTITYLDAKLGEQEKTRDGIYQQLMASQKESTDNIKEIFKLIRDEKEAELRDVKAELKRYRDRE